MWVCTQAVASLHLCNVSLETGRSLNKHVELYMLSIQDLTPGFPPFFGSKENPKYYLNVGFYMVFKV